MNAQVGYIQYKSREQNAGSRTKNRETTGQANKGGGRGNRKASDGEMGRSETK